MTRRTRIRDALLTKQIDEARKRSRRSATSGAWLLTTSLNAA